ncbi:hypothetical protein BDC45DRAFT_275903 [Circinella umbellata]|nr:hypothetical protein BDC45DRAFT_275903 [Circinella umbellata]
MLSFSHTRLLKKRPFFHFIMLRTTALFSAASRAAAYSVRQQTAVRAVRAVPAVPAVFVRLYTTSVTGENGETRVLDIEKGI